MEAEERKKEREVKITDRLPPPKRARGCMFPFFEFLSVANCFISRGSTESAQDTLPEDQE